jgi:hypothetical protein
VLIFGKFEIYQRQKCLEVWHWQSKQLDGEVVFENLKKGNIFIPVTIL